VRSVEKAQGSTTVVALPVVSLCARRRAAEGRQQVRALASARERSLIARSYPRSARLPRPARASSVQACALLFLHS
jgi:hypothetical protein